MSTRGDTAPGMSTRGDAAPGISARGDRAFAAVTLRFRHTPEASGQRVVPPVPAACQLAPLAVPLERCGFLCERICQPGAAGPPHPSKGRKGRGVTRGLVSGQEVAVGAPLASSSPEGHWRGTAGTEGAKPTQRAEGWGQGTPQPGGLPQRRACPAQGSAAVTVRRKKPAPSQPMGTPGQEAEPASRPRGSSGDPRTRLPAWLRAATAHSPDPQTPRAWTGGAGGTAPSLQQASEAVSGGGALKTTLQIFL